jgi:hypothetical protein
VIGFGENEPSHVNALMRGRIQMKPYLRVLGTAMLEICVQDEWLKLEMDKLSRVMFVLGISFAHTAECSFGG